MPKFPTGCKNNEKDQDYIIHEKHFNVPRHERCPSLKNYEEKRTSEADVGAIGPKHTLEREDRGRNLL
jgi:hypothetical protein